MGNFEKLSVLVIGVIIVMILVVAIYTWTGNPDETGTPVAGVSTAEGRLRPTDLSASLQGERETWDRYDRDTRPVDTESVIVEDIVNRDKLSGDDETGVKLVKETVIDEDLSGARTVVAKVEEVYEIQRKDTLGLISQKFYGTTRYWPKIAERNNLVPERLRLGQKIFIPVIDDMPIPGGSSPATPRAASHAGGAKPGSLYKVRGGETIQQIARAAYGTIERWPEIWVANLEVLKDPKALRAGIELRLPE